MIDVVLPVLNEAAALPWVLGRMPAGYRPIVVDNGSDGRIGGDRGGARGARGARAAARVRRRVLGRAARRDGGRRVLHGLRRLADPRELPRVCGARRADLVLGARAERGAWPLHARAGEPGAGRSSWPPASASRCATSARCARRRARRCSSSGSSTGASAGRSRWSCARRRGLAGRGVGRDLPAPQRPLEGDRDRARHRCGPSATWPRARMNLIVIAKAPVAGRAKTRLCPPCTPQQAADLAEAALADTLDAVLVDTGRAARDRARRRARRLAARGLRRRGPARRRPGRAARGRLRRRRRAGAADRDGHAAGDAGAAHARARRAARADAVLGSQPTAATGRSASGGPTGLCSRACR